MKILITMVTVALSVTHLASAAEVDNAQYTGVTNVVAMMSGKKVIAQCKLAIQPKKVEPRFNWNKTIVLLNDVDYVQVEDIEKCSNDVASVNHIPDHAGFVVDVNPQAKIYLSMDVISVSPMTYTALVSRLGSRQPIGTYPGMYSAKKSLEKLQEESLEYNEGSPGRISPDGRYVSVDGSMTCGNGSFPGVWDLKNKTLVKGRADCAALFSTKVP